MIQLKHLLDLLVQVQVFVNVYILLVKNKHHLLVYVFLAMLHVGFNGFVKHYSLKLPCGVGEI